MFFLCSGSVSQPDTFRNIYPRPEVLRLRIFSTIFCTGGILLLCGIPSFGLGGYVVTVASFFSLG